MKHRNKRKRVGMLFPLLVLSLSLSGCGGKDEDTGGVSEGVNMEAEGFQCQNGESEEQKKEQTDQLVEDCITYKAKGNLQYVALQQELMNLDPVLAARIENIFTFWDQCRQEDYVKRLHETGEPEDLDTCCIVILGFQLNADGTMKDELVGRLQTALEYANALPSSKVLVTGGGTAFDNPLATEADCMAEWLVEHGVEAERIIIENRSRTTVENALFSCDILYEDYPEVTELIMVSSDYHVALGALLFAANIHFDGKEEMAVVESIGYEIGLYSRYSMQSEGEQLKELFHRK